MRDNMPLLAVLDLGGVSFRSLLAMQLILAPLPTQPTKCRSIHLIAVLI
jgi:hypothetical protein